MRVFMGRPEATPGIALRASGLILVFTGAILTPPFFLRPAAAWRLDPAQAQGPAPDQLRELVTLLARSPCVSISPDGKTVVAAAEGGIITLWDTATGRERVRLQGRCSSLFALAFSPDGNTVAAAAGADKVKVWDAATGKEIGPLEGQTGFVEAAVFAPDGKTLAAGNVQGTVRLWDLTTRKERAAYHTRAGICRLAYAPDGKTLASGDRGGHVRFWDVATGQEVRSIKVNGGAAFRLAYAPDGKTIVTNSGEGPPQLWDPETGREKAVVTGGIPGPVSFSPDGKILALGRSREGVVEFRDAVTLKELAVWPAHQEAVLDLTFSPHGKVLATAGRDKTAKLWDVVKILEQKPQDQKAR